MPNEDGSDGDLEEENKRKASKFGVKTSSIANCTIVYCTEPFKSDGKLNSCAI